MRPPTLWPMSPFPVDHPQPINCSQIMKIAETNAFDPRNDQ